MKICVHTVQNTIIQIIIQIAHFCSRVKTVVETRPTIMINSYTGHNLHWNFRTACYHIGHCLKSILFSYVEAPPPPLPPPLPPTCYPLRGLMRPPWEVGPVKNNFNSSLTKVFTHYIPWLFYFWIWRRCLKFTLCSCGPWGPPPGPQWGHMYHLKFFKNLNPVPLRTIPAKVG